MKMKKFGAVLLAIFAVSAIAAGNAFAASEYKETGGAWYTGSSPGTKLAEGSSKTVTGSIGGEKASLETTVAGTAVDITWTLWELTESFFRNEGTVATTRDVWTLQAVNITVPANCSVPSTITTKPLSGIVGMNTAGTLATVKFSAAEGTTLATIEITGEKCAIAGLYKLSGTVFAQASNATGVFAASQSIQFSKAIQESAGTATSLKFGENAAFITGTLKTSIGGTEFATKEK
jgi:hypothetical protein